MIEQNEEPFKEVSKIAADAAVEAKAEVDYFAASEGILDMPEPIRKAYFLGASIGGSAMIKAVTRMLPKIGKLSEGKPDEDSAPNPFE